MVYHSLIPAALGAKLESIQRQALRIICGCNSDIDNVMTAKNIETLNERREKAVLRFALKNENKERYGKRWLKEALAGDRPRRDPKKYIVPCCRTERMKSNPITVITKALNKHYSN